MIAIIDYGVGNLFSLSSSLRYLGLETTVTADAKELERADRIILPGVGAFADAIAKLRSTGLVDTIRAQAAAGKPLLGICLGMQLLFDKSYEYGEHEGLGLVPGQVVPLADRLPAGLKVPHIGWNRLQILRKEDPLFKYSGDEDYVYYVHSYYADNCAESTLAVSEYGIPVTGVVRCGSVLGTQFHPEKSGEAGLRLLRAFSEL
ncbi:MAG TPA: imidazole glycerol phosphate synthase subunit HisH [Candidatus Pygmaiobacter gallistercoris]|nr:imidazole glycerol phosphate synthase subunit HisH [Candidatus Pygmaiobacter gallistercoris]